MHSFPGIEAESAASMAECKSFCNLCTAGEGTLLQEEGEHGLVLSPLCGRCHNSVWKSLVPCDCPSPAQSECWGTVELPGVAEKDAQCSMG